MSRRRMDEEGLVLSGVVFCFGIFLIWVGRRLNS